MTDHLDWIVNVYYRYCWQGTSKKCFYCCHSYLEDDYDEDNDSAFLEQMRESCVYNHPQSIDLLASYFGVDRTHNGFVKRFYILNFYSHFLGFSWRLCCVLQLLNVPINTRQKSDSVILSFLCLLSCSLHNSPVLIGGYQGMFHNPKQDVCLLFLADVSILWFFVCGHYLLLIWYFELIEILYTCLKVFSHHSIVFLSTGTKHSSLKSPWTNFVKSSLLIGPWACKKHVFFTSNLFYFYLISSAYLDF